MGLSLALRLNHVLEQKQMSILEQKMFLKNMLLLKQQLRHPELKDPAKGLGGMILADDILKQKNSKGILIGGLCEKIWNPQINIEDLEKSKDVDVLVLDEDLELSEDFEGGIDWWLPKNYVVNVNTDSGAILNYNQNVHENGFGAILKFQVNQRYDLKSPGLYIPNPLWIIAMRYLEAKSINLKGITIEDNSEEIFEKFMRKNLKSSVPSFIFKYFKNQILSSKYNNYDTQDHIELYKIDYEILSAIEKKKDYN